MFGGYELILEGAAVSSILFFIVVLLGINYKQRSPGVASKGFWVNGENSYQTKTPNVGTVSDIVDDRNTLNDDGEVDEYGYEYEPYGDDYEYEPYGDDYEYEPYGNDYEYEPEED